MSASVKSVPNPYFGVGELASFAGSIVSRRRVKIPCSFPTTYSHNGQSSLPYVVRFDIADPECFFDTDSLRLSFDFTPIDSTGATGVRSTYRAQHQFVAEAKDEATVAAVYPNGASAVIDNTIYKGKGTNAYARLWPEEWCPILDGGASALMSRIRIGNAQGLLIEEHVNYNLWANVAQKLRSQTSVDGDLTNRTADNLPFIRCASEKYLVELQNISIFKQMRYFPLFLFRSALRVEIEFEQPKLAWYYPKIIYGSAPSIGLVKSTVDAAPNGPLAWDSTVLVQDKYALDDTSSHCLRLHLSGHSKNVPYIDVQITSRPKPSATEALDNQLIGLLPLHVYGSTAANTTTTAWFASYFTGESNVRVGKIEWIHYPFRVLSVGDTTAGNNVFFPSLFDWNYKIENAELMMDFVKPSSEVMVSYINQYNSPGGIPYSYLRTFYHTKMTESGTSQSPFQMTLPFSVRSLKAVIVAISDPLSSYTGNDNTYVLFPSLSAFQMRGLREAQLVVGAQQFPSYQLRFDQPADSPFVNQHLPELELITSTMFSTGNHSMKPKKLLRYGEDYSDFGFYDATQSKAGSDAAAVTALIANRGVVGNSKCYRDTRDFILGFSTQKFDGDFASGIDTTASGSVTLNLYFDAHGSRARQIHVWGLADAVFTCQKDASLVRY